jgi:rRNA maturation endonuclease Nob1
LLKNILNQLGKSSDKFQSKEAQINMTKKQFCQNCGKEFNDLTVKVCDACGSKL